MNRDHRPGSAALGRPVDDQFVSGQARQSPPDGLEVVAAFTTLGDQLDDLGQPHPVIGDPAPTAQQLEDRRQDVSTGTPKTQL